MRTTGILLLLALLASVAGAESFDEPFETDIDQNGIPDFWVRVIEPGRPRYNEIEFPDRKVFFSGASSLHFRMHGGGARLRCEKLLAVDPGLVYELVGRIKTAGFDRDLARLGVEWLDRTGGLLGTESTEPVGGTHDWSRVELRFEGMKGDVRFARLICDVAGDDIAGDAWFDEIVFSERVALSADAPGHPGNVFAEGEEVRLLLRAPTLQRGNYRLAARIVRFDGSELPAQPRVDILVGKSDVFEFLYAAPIRETGYFDVWLEVRRGETLLASRRVPIGVVPKVRSGPSVAGEYGVVVDPYEARVDQLLGHLAGMPLGRAKLLLRDRREPPPPRGPELPDPVERALRELRRMGTDPIGILAPPARVLVPGSSDWARIDGFADWCALPTETWEPELLEILARYQGYLSRWQLGADGDFSFALHADGGALAERALAAVAKATRYPILGVSADPSAAGGGDGGRLQFRSLELPAGLDPDAAGAALRAALRAGAPAAVSCTIPDVSLTDRYAGLREQVVHLVKTALAARAAGARDCYFHPLMGAQAGLFDIAGDPTPAYFAVRTLNLLVSGAQLDPRPFAVEDGVESLVFERGGERVAALWMRGGQRPREMTLALGEEARILDPTGRVLDVPREDLDRRVTVSDVPVYLTDLDGGLLQTELGVGYQGRQVLLKTGRQRETLRVVNGFGEPVQNVEARVRLPEEARGWRLDLRERRRGRLAPGETWEIPIDVELPESEGIEEQETTVDLRFDAPLREYRFSVRRRLELRSDISLALDAKQDGSGKSYQVTLTVKNAADRTMDLKCYLFMEGRPVEPRLLPRLAAGATETLRFLVAGGIGEMRAHVEEIRGSAFCNRTLRLE